ncbi:MAG: sialate O-acetylesterase [Pricia sp.]
MNHGRPISLLLFLIVSMSSTAQISLPQIFRDSMVFQRNANIKIWGWASNGEEISVRLNGKKRTTVATAEGDWEVEFPQMKAGGPYSMRIVGTNRIDLSQILIGDVWLCAGQSNMVHQLDIHDISYAKDIETANYPEIRHFKIPTQTELTGPKKDFEGGSWKSAVSNEIRPFSAVAYFFAKKIYDKYKVPIGLVNASVGGTPIESWISEQGFQEFPEILKTIEKNKDTVYVNSLSGNSSSQENEVSEEVKDKGLIGPTPWFNINFEPENWRNINIPGYWEDQGVKDLNGVVWYRRKIKIPASMANKEARVFLGRIVDADELYINGEKIGGKTYQYPQRRYDVPKNLLKEGENIFAIKVTNYFGKGGFVPDKPYYLFSGKDTIDLKGYWKYKVGDVFVPRERSTSTPRPINAQNEPTALYNAMVAPYKKLQIKGILWYQGESNTGNPEEYAGQLSALIENWRTQFNAPNLPFITAQLPNFMDVSYLPTESNWAVLRESQLQSLDHPNTALTVNIDLGEWNDIHPDNKKDVGERMALAALDMAYGEDIVSSGPIYHEHRIEGNKVFISFSNLGGGLTTDDGKAPSEFAIAGEDKKFVWAQAKIEGNKVIVWNDNIPDPQYVRYAWADNPDNPNLYNKEGLPASPFRIKK